MGIDRFVFLTTDGLRWDEFHRRDLLPNLYGETNWNILGSTKEGPGSFSASHPSLISLPCYQTMSTGRVDLQRTNNESEPVGDTVWDELDDQGRKGAIFASWSPIRHATGNALFFANKKDDEPSTPWKQVRYDRHTFSDAWQWFDQEDPDYLWIALAETDDIAHEKDFSKYTSAVTRFDGFVHATVNKLNTLPGRSVLLVSTDHGRGTGDHWHDHHEGLQYAKHIWAVVRGFNCEVSINATNAHSQLDLRPTITNLFNRKTSPTNMFEVNHD